ncbi:MAG: hypothetical protein OHK0012_15970 [Synechococcales cyanobacterium]
MVPPPRLTQWIDILLRQAGHRRLNRLDQEIMELYQEDHLKIQRLTSQIDDLAVVVVTVAGRTVLLVGDALNQVYVPGAWEEWLQRRVESLTSP